MKKKYILFLLLTCIVNVQQILAQTKACGNDEFGHTFFSIRQEYQSAFPIKNTLMRNRAKARCAQGGNVAFQLVPFYGKSNKGNNLMKFFGPCPKTELVVDSHPTTGGQTGIDRDINPIHFGINYVAGNPADPRPGRFKSTIRFSPQRTISGLGFTYKQYFGRQENACEKKWSYEFSVPIMHVRNKVNFEEECDCAAREGFPAAGSAINMRDAFKGERGFLGLSEQISFGKINDESTAGMSKTGSEIEFKLVYDFYNTQELLFDLYTGFNAPINRVPDGVQLFEAIPGFNQHWAVMFGGNVGTLLWQDESSMIALIVGSNFRYFIKNTQVRSFDLKGRKWSRYMIVRTPSGTISPGINVFTQPMRVQPRASFDMNIGFVYDTIAGMEIEFGYNFFARQGEKVCLKNEFPSGYATVGFNPTTLTPDPTMITVNSDIAGNGCPLPAPGQPGFIPGSTITEDDLNLLSAAHPAYQSNQIYISVGSLWNNFTHPLALGLGTSYEFSGKNTALNRWLMWVKFGVSL